MIVPPPGGVGTASRCSNTGQPTAPTRVDLQMCSRISLVRQCEQSLREALFRVWGPHGGPIFALRVTQSSRESVPWIWNDQVGDTNRLTTRRVDLIVYVTGLLPEPPRSIFRAWGRHGGPILVLRVTQSTRGAVPWIWNNQVGDRNRLPMRRVD